MRKEELTHYFHYMEKIARPLFKFEERTITLVKLRNTIIQTLKKLHIEEVVYSLNFSLNQTKKLQENYFTL